jgi:hypothetical protein
VSQGFFCVKWSLKYQSQNSSETGLRNYHQLIACQNKNKEWQSLCHTLLECQQKGAASCQVQTVVVSRERQVVDPRAAGKYNERAFKALDYILDEASKVGVRLILTMTDNWSPADSKTQVTDPSILEHSCCC